MSHALRADRLLIKPTAGARPASPCTLGRFIRKARTRGLTPDESRTPRTTPGWQRPLTDRPNESHRRQSRTRSRPRGIDPNLPRSVRRRACRLSSQASGRGVSFGREPACQSDPNGLSRILATTPTVWLRGGSHRDLCRVWPRGSSPAKCSLRADGLATPAGPSSIRVDRRAA